VFGTIGRFLDLNTAVVLLAALLSVVLAVWRRDRVTLGLAAGVCAWVIVEIAFSLHGWPGLARYMFPAGALLMVLAGIAVGRLLSLADAGPWRWAGGVAATAVVVALIPSAVSHARSERRDLRDQRARTTQIKRLSGMVERLGGAALLRSCGEPLTRLEYQTIAAWTLGLNVARVGWKYGPAVASRRPIVLFTPSPHGGWVIQALHQRTPACRRLPR
jgi:hypothetical protein